MISCFTSSLPLLWFGGSGGGTEQKNGHVSPEYPPGWIFTTQHKESRVEPTASRRYHHPQNGVVYDSFTTQSGRRGGNIHRVFLLANLVVQGGTEWQDMISVEIEIMM